MVAAARNHGTCPSDLEQQASAVLYPTQWGKPGNYPCGDEQDEQESCDGLTSAGRRAGFDYRGYGYQCDCRYIQFIKLLQQCQPWIDLYALGNDVLTTRRNTDTAIVGPESGTSYAAPLVSGAAALLWGHRISA